MTEQDDRELVASVLVATREQLNRAMALCAELEALLTLERRKSADLANQLFEKKADGK